MASWKTDVLSGQRVLTRPHLVTCATCDGAGWLLADGVNRNDPDAIGHKCEDCRGSGQKLCGNVDGCCDHDPPEDD